MVKKCDFNHEKNVFLFAPLSPTNRLSTLIPLGTFVLKLEQLGIQPRSEQIMFHSIVDLFGTKLCLDERRLKRGNGHLSQKSILHSGPNSAFSPKPVNTLPKSLPVMTPFT